MTQEMGSLAKDVGLLLAQSLNLEMMRHEVVEHLSEKMEMPKSVIRRLREGKAGLVERLTTDSQKLAVYTAEEVFAQANRGNVVLRGWGATCLLRPVPHVVCVRITRSLDKRIEWLMANLETDDCEFAESELRRSDAAHAARMHRQFGVTWGDPLLYDMVLNTDRISVEGCVEQISRLAARPEFQETEASRAMLADMTLEARIRAALKDNAATGGVHVTIEPRDGHVVLRGIVVNAEERNESERAAAMVAGVASVDNQLRVMSTSRRFTSAKY
jgi:osmotically-inducible protein OsmY